MTFGAEVDEGGFEAGFDAGDLAFVDVGLFLLARAGLDVQVVETLAVHQGYTQLFGLSRVNQHSFHVVPSVSGLPETAFGTHDVSWSVPRCAKGGQATPCRATFGTSRLPSLPLSRRRVLFAAVPTRPRWLRIGIRINQAGLVHSVRRRNQPSAVDARRASVQDLIRSPAVSGLVAGRGATRSEGCASPPCTYP